MQVPKPDTPFSSRVDCVWVRSGLQIHVLLDVSAKGLWRAPLAHDRTGTECYFVFALIFLFVFVFGDFALQLRCAVENLAGRILWSIAQLKPLAR